MCVPAMSDLMSGSGDGGRLVDNNEFRLLAFVATSFNEFTCEDCKDKPKLKNLIEYQRHQCHECRQRFAKLLATIADTCYFLYGRIRQAFHALKLPPTCRRVLASLASRMLPYVFV